MAEQPYSDLVMAHFMNPHNVGDIPDADGIGTVGNVVCGDVMKMFIKVENNIVVDAKFKTFGCGAAISTSSMVTDMVKGKTIEEALQITNKTVAEALGGLPAIKMHCSVLAEEALSAAIADYFKRKSLPLPEKLVKILEHLGRHEHEDEKDKSIDKGETTQ